MSIYRPEFEAALRAFGRASLRMAEMGFELPVLVGGAAVELYSGSAISTGDFDVVTAAQEGFEYILREQGFRRPSGAGTSTRGWIHPALGLGFEVVGAALLDGLADRARIRIIDLGADGKAAVLSVEDLIADRMGQYASGSAFEMLAQARALVALFPDVASDYLERRIREKTAGENGIETLRE